MNTLTEDQLNKIAHTLGVNLYHAKLSKSKKDKYLPDEFYRNYYNYSLIDNQMPQEFQELLDKDIIKTWIQFKNNYFCISDEGVAKFREWFKENVTDTYKPLSKSKEKYQEYLHSDIGLTFAEYFGIWEPKIEFKFSGFTSVEDNMRRYVSTKYNGVHGEYKANNKEAKQSYKEALSLYKLQLKDN